MLPASCQNSRPEFGLPIKHVHDGRWEYFVGGVHAGGQMVPEQPGLRAERTARIRVRWPDGAESIWPEISAERHSQIERRDDRLASIANCVAGCTPD